MVGQSKLIAGIHSFSPARENWAAAPAESPSRHVTVSFKTGQTGLLDMKNPRAAHWATMIDRAERAGQPVYVEVDQESKVITNVLIPRVFKVQRLDPDERGNLIVRLRPSSGLHLLLRSDPNFESMRASLQAARDDGSERLITETRDQHEIFDVRQPEGRPGEPSGPAPPPLPDPPVSEARAGELFTAMSGHSCDPTNPSSDCLPFLYPDDGCWIRAHIMCHWMRTGGPDTTTNPQEDPEKVWIDFTGASYVPTANHPDCQVGWGWHVAPTLLVTLPGGDEKRVIDPSLCASPVSEAAWKLRQVDPGATLTDTDWADYNWAGDTNVVSLAQAQADMQYYRDALQDRCLHFGPPPYSCNKGCFFIIDRSTFSDAEIEAMLVVSNPAVVQAAFYVVVDGFSPDDLGFTSATMEMTPNLTISPTVPGMTITPDRLEFEYPTFLNRRQRLTWVYNISFATVAGFTAEVTPVRMDASLETVSGTGYLYFIQQPAPYEVDGSTSWLSTDLRVFQIKTGESKFGATMGSNASAFVTEVLTRLNAGNTGGQSFETDISVDQQTSRLELSQSVGGTPVYNFAIAKVRYRALSVGATDVRVFFRLFPAATTSLVYDQATTYRRHEAAGSVISLLGVQNSDVTVIPCFASSRIDSASVSMTTQTDDPNRQTIPANASGAEVVRYFGCWLDINQTQPQFPLQPSPVDGPYSSGRVSVQDHVRNEHQCLVSEIAFSPAPIPVGATPSVSDKLAQRNLAIVQSANPGLVSSRRIPQTFEIRASKGALEHDELMIDWGNVPVGTSAALFLPGFDSSGIVRVAARKYRSHRLVVIDEQTLRLEAGGITYIPIPYSEGSRPGMLTVDLPEGIRKGQVFKVVVRQVTGQDARGPISRKPEAHKPGGRHIVGSFQLTIPVRDKTEMLPGQQRLLSNLRWIERAIPSDNRWAAVFGRYVSESAARVDALGGDASKVAPSPSGQWKEAYARCRLLGVATALLLAVGLFGLGALAGAGWAAVSIAVLALAGGVFQAWTRTCRPTECQRLLALLAGFAIGAVALALFALFRTAPPWLIFILLISAAAAAWLAYLGRQKGCFK